MKRVREVKDPTATRLREGDALVARRCRARRAIASCCSRRTGTVYVLRVADVPATTGYGEPVQSLLKFGDGERVVAARLMRDERAEPRSSRPAGAARDLGGSEDVQPCAGRDGRRATASAPRPISPRRRAPAGGSRASATATRSSSVEPIDGPVGRGRDGARQDAALRRSTRSPSSSGPGRGVILMKPDSGRPHRRRAGARQEGRRSSPSRPRAASASSALAEVPVGQRGGKGQKVVKRGGVAAIRLADK